MRDDYDKHEVDPNTHSRRDGETLLMLGAFICLLALPVIAGTLFIQSDDLFPKVVNILAGTVLLIIGAALAYRGKHYLSRM